MEIKITPSSESKSLAKISLGYINVSQAEWELLPDKFKILSASFSSIPIALASWFVVNLKLSGYIKPSEPVLYGGSI